MSDVHWEAHDGRTRLPAHLAEAHTAETSRGKAGITFGRQIGAYPILIGVEYHIPLETQSNIVITGHGARSITGVETGLNHQTMSQKQLEAIPGIGQKTAWKLISQRAKQTSKGRPSFESPASWFEQSKIEWNEDYSIYFDV